MQNMTGVLRWERPPDPGYRGAVITPRRPWPLVAAQLMANPGEWGVVMEDGGSNSGTAVARINNGLTQWFQPAGAFAAVSRTVDGTIIVYAVFLGYNQEYAEQASIAQIPQAA